MILTIRILYYYLIQSSDLWIDLKDYINNTDDCTIYHIIEGALKLNNGKLFGSLDKKNILMSIIIRSEDDFQNLLAKISLNPEFLIKNKEIDPSEFDKTLNEIFKKGKMYETEYEVLDYLKKINYKFEDKTIPISTNLLDNWYVPIHSNMSFKQFHDFYKTYKKEREIIFIIYKIIDEVIHCKDDRLFGLIPKFCVYLNDIS